MANSSMTLSAQSFLNRGSEMTFDDAVEALIAEHGVEKVFEAVSAKYTASGAYAVQVWSLEDAESLLKDYSLSVRQERIVLSRIKDEGGLQSANDFESGWEALSSVVYGAVRDCGF